ncbi:hypothetical protein SASPL_139178 [Salvia splendens]|uniref:Rab-GAP TBC domain-containing protein n=1 Tax=Salvia splendens TaxID=180675 RepID=A0A8X8WUU0_SALSN|nr:hypothetical protein SASPL_139178 [Salvia splendens]
MKAKGAAAVLNPVSLEHKRDAYGFAVRPQHLQRYREYANIYKEEEEERSDRWKDFLERQSGSGQFPENKSTDINADDSQNNVADSYGNQTKPNISNEANSELRSEKDGKVHRVQTWTEIRSSLCAIEDFMSSRVKKKVSFNKSQSDLAAKKPLQSIDETRPGKGAPEEDSEEEFYDVERSGSESDSAPEIPGHATHSETPPPWKEELECLVQGGVPMALRGELWQAFVGVRARRVENYYQNLLASDTNTKTKSSQLKDKGNDSNLENVVISEKWRGQIEKDLPRTFPGHPALDEDGRNALRRLLTAYARHNPSVGYCQAMNFFAGLLLLLMSEENAFWALVGLLDDYFDGYYSEEMVESQVDQLVLEELVREKFPKLGCKPSGLPGSAGGVGDCPMVPHNIYEYASMGKRVWDVILFQGNRVMLFRTALALMELYGPALVTTKDAGDAVTLLQSLAGSTFDSSQLVLTACSGYQNVIEERLQELRNNHRPTVIAALEERSKGMRVWRDSQCLSSKLYSFKQDAGSIIRTDKPEGPNGDVSHLDGSPAEGDELFVNGDVEMDPAKDLQEQVAWLKVEQCKLIEEKRSAELRAEELEIALMEMVKQDNRRQLSAKVEKMQRELSELRSALVEKHEQENAMLQILMRVEQAQKVTEDARIYAEQDAAAQRYAAQVLEAKCEQVALALADMEKRAVMAESMLEATLQYQSGQTKAMSSPRSTQQSNQEPSQDVPARKISLLARPFGLGWRDKNKEKPASLEEQNDVKLPNEEKSVNDVQSEVPV